MALIGQHQQTAFSDPQAGQSPISAAVVRGNDNAIRATHNAHDADATIHVQTGLLASRPAAGTVNAMYMDENARLYLDNGLAWLEIPYARLAAASSTFTGDVAVEGNLAVDGNTALGATQADSLNVLSNPTVNGGPIPQAAVANLVSDLAGKAANSHTHDASAIVSGTLNSARLPTIAEAASAGRVSILLGARGFFPEPSEPAVIRAGGTDGYISASAPTGGIQRWLRITIDGVNYSILATRTAP